MKLNLILTILWFTLNFAFAQTSEFVPKYITTLTEESGKSLMNQCSRKSYKEVNKFWVIDTLNLNNLITHFKEITTQKADNRQKITELSNYGYQLIGIEINNKKFIYVNAFGIGEENPDQTRDSLLKNWRFKPISVCDGGDYFWGILFDIETNEFSQLSINGGF